MLTTLQHQSLRIIVRTTSCIVTSSPVPLGDRNVLVVPANSDLCGTQLPYFPHPDFPAPAKDVPPSAWGGVDMGSNTFYPVQCVDGVLQVTAPDIRRLTANHSCAVGSAFLLDCDETRKLLPHFDAICHVVPPLWKTNSTHEHDVDQRAVLGRAYTSALSKSFHGDHGDVVASLPLLGCGARCAPPKVSIEEAVKSIVNYSGSEGTVDFALQCPELCSDLLSSFQNFGVARVVA
jgi:hypothetical protein